MEQKIFFLALLDLKRHLNEREMINEQPCETSAKINKWEPLSPMPSKEALIIHNLSS